MCTGWLDSLYKPRDCYIYKLYNPWGFALSELPSSTIRLSKPQATTRSERKAQRRLGGYLPETDALPSGRGIDVGAAVPAVAKRGLKSETIEGMNTSAPTTCKKRIKASNNAISA